VFDDEVDPMWRMDLWHLVKETPFLDWLFVTKRPEAIPSMLPPDWGQGWLNVCLMTSVEDQTRTARIGELIQVPARFRGVLLEPLLAPVQLMQEWMPHLNWILVAGEAREGARPMHPDWVRSIRQQCAASGVNFFFKGWGSWSPNAKFAKLDLANVASFEHGSQRPLFFAEVEASRRQSVLDNRGERSFMFRGNEAKTGQGLDGRRYLAHPFGQEIAPLLNSDGRERLDNCEKTVRAGLQTFVEVGLALMEIRNSRLYLETHPTFEAYVQAMMALSRPRAYELMDCAEVMRDLSAAGDVTQLPRNEAQVRELRKWKTPEERTQKWKSVLAAASGKRPVTATFIRKTLNPPSEPKSAVAPLTQKMQGYLKKLRSQANGNVAEQNALELISKLEHLMENPTATEQPTAQPSPAPLQPRIIRFQMSGPAAVRIIR
jgi:hypothetical protein